MNDVTGSVGTRTDTSKPQDAVAPLASVVVQDTLVVPTSKLAPTVGVQLVSIGCAPPVTCGFW
jgi:hypothetical protein